jgi:RND family efflux transporter MFP subunit
MPALTLTNNHKKRYMNTRTLLITFSAALGLTVFIIACAHKTQQKESVADNIEIPVKLLKATSETVSDPVVASGFISSSTEARLSFKTGGIIERIYVEEGQSVTKGQLLATLNLTEINAMVDQAKQGFDKAQRDYDRAKNLYRDTVATLEQFQNATTGLNVARQQYEMARFNQSYSEIRATVNGKIVRKLMNEGEIVGVGTPVFFMNAAGASDWVVKVGVADKDWARLKLGNHATVKIDAYPDEVFSGTVSQLSQAPDPMSGLYQAEVKLNPTGKSLATGLFAKAEIKPNSNAQYVSVPVDAITEGNGKEAFVFTVQNNKANKQPVKVAFIKDGKVMLTAGVDSGTQVIVDGSAYLTNGATVKVMQ